MENKIEEFQPSNYQEKLDAFKEKLARQIDDYLGNLTKEHTDNYGQARTNKSKAEAVKAKLQDKGYDWPTLLTYLREILVECVSGVKEQKNYENESVPVLIDTETIKGGGWFDSNKFNGIYLKTKTVNVVTSYIDEVNSIVMILQGAIVVGSKTYDELRSRQLETVQLCLNQYHTDKAKLTTELAAEKVKTRELEGKLQMAQEDRQAQKLVAAKVPGLETELQRLRQELGQLREAKAEVSQQLSAEKSKTAALSATVSGKDERLQDKDAEIKRAQTNMQIISAATDKLEKVSTTLAIYNEHEAAKRQQVAAEPEKEVKDSDKDWAPALKSMGFTDARKGLLVQLIERYMDEPADSNDRQKLYDAIKALIVSNLKIQEAYPWNSEGCLEYKPQVDDAGFKEGRKAQIAGLAVRFIAFNAHGGGDHAEAYAQLGGKLDKDINPSMAK